MKMFLTVFGAILGAAFGQTTGAIWGGIIGFLVSFGYQPTRKSQPPPAEKTPQPVLEPQIPAIRVEFRYGSTPVSSTRGVKPLQWIPPGEQIAFGGTVIPGGMIYLSDGPADVFEPSVLNRKLPISAPAVGADGQLPYFPSYETITPAQRGTYIEWLAQGRRDSDPAVREFGYLFLFFYGLERRVLIEGDMSQEIGEEIANLINVYSPHGRSKSLPTYFSQLLQFWAFHQGPERYAKLWPWILELEHSVLDADELQLVLGSLGAAGQNAPARVAREIAYHSDDAIRSNVATRSPQEFRALFDQRFANEFPAGLPLVTGQRAALAKYLPASAVLRYESDSANGRFVARTKYVSVPPADRSKLIELWNGCCTSLSGYVRAKARSTGKEIDLVTLLATPPELRSRQVTGLSARLEELLTTAAKDEGYFFLAASALCTFFGVPARERYTTTQSKQVAKAIETLGWLVEPDPRTHGAAFASDQEVVLFQSEPTTPSTSFLGRCALVQMSVTLAGCDDSFDLRESETIGLMIDGSDAADSEKHRLRAWAMLLGRDINNAPASIGKVAKAVPAQNSQAVAQLLCRVAAADHIVTKGEQRLLERLFRNLGLTPEIAGMLRAELDGFDEVSVARAEKPRPGERIPAAAIEDGKARFELDRERVRALAAETAEVIQILAVAMADAEHEADEPTAAPKQPVRSVVLPPWTNGLDAKFAPLAARIAERDLWPRKDFDALAAELHVMPNGAFDAINEWSDEALGDFLLAGEDPVEVNRALLPSHALEAIS